MTHDRTLLLVGLGNPGREYTESRHNTGFRAIEAVAAHYNVDWQTKEKFKGEMASGLGDGVKLIFLKPTTFMNLSGQAVAAVKNFFTIDDKDVWVFHDDLDLPLGKMQTRQGGGLAGHHGLESIAESIGSSDFVRFRIGIRGHELRTMHGEQGIDTNDFVMGSFTSRERDILNRMMQEIVTVIQEFLKTKTVTSHTFTVDGYETFQSAEH